MDKRRQLMKREWFDHHVKKKNWKAIFLDIQLLLWSSCFQQTSISLLKLNEKEQTTVTNDRKDVQFDALIISLRLLRYFHLNMHITFTLVWCIFVSIFEFVHRQTQTHTQQHIDRCDNIKTDSETIFLIFFCGRARARTSLSSIRFLDRFVSFCDWNDRRLFFASSASIV